MRSHRARWLCLAAALIALLDAASAYARPRQGWSTQGRLTQDRAGAAEPAAFQSRPPAARETAQEHLQKWMERRSNLTLSELLRALENEPLFRSYPPLEQQRMRDQLIRLYNMRQPQRDQLLKGNEVLEHMTQQQRQQFTVTMRQYAALPTDRHLLVSQAFKLLRRVPPRDREAAMKTAPFLAQLTPYERSLLSSLLLWEPYFTPQAASH
jgi:hypothetical protein